MKKFCIVFMSICIVLNIFACSDNSSLSNAETQVSKSSETIESKSTSVTSETSNINVDSNEEREVSNMVDSSLTDSVNEQIKNLEHEKDDAESIVYFTKNLDSASLVKIYEKLGVELEGKVAVKVSTGEAGNNYYLKGDLIGDLVKKINGTIVECNTAYGGSRAETMMHKQVARDHGWYDIASVDIMDEDGEMEIPINKGSILKSDIVGINLSNYDSMLCLSHFKGHAMGGFGGALKNMSIGVGSPSGKANIHSAGRTKNVSELWNYVDDQDGFVRAMAEAAESVRDYLNGKVLYINVMNNISIDCDCNGNPKAPEMHDVGILASTNPVALDQACVDIVYNTDRKESGSLIDRIEDRHGILILEHSVEIGAGSRNYKLVSID